MMFNRTQIKHYTNFEILINNDIVDHINNTKFLKVIIDSKLNWAAHILYIKSKISKSIGILLKIRKFIQNNTMRNMYFTFIYTYLIYCIEVWGNAHQMHLDPLMKIQKKSIQTITFSHYLAHSEPLFERLNILDMQKNGYAKNIFDNVQKLLKYFSNTIKSFI